MTHHTLSRAGKIRELTDIPSSLCHLIIKQYTYWDITNENMEPSDNMRGDMFEQGWSPSGWPRGQNRISWGRNVSGLVWGEPHKGERWNQRPLKLSLEAIWAKITASHTWWPQGHIPGILLSDTDVLGSLWTDVIHTTCVAKTMESESEGVIFWVNVLADVVWTLVYGSVWHSSI